METPNVRFSPDKKRIIFTSSMFGPSYVFGVEVDEAQSFNNLDASLPKDFHFSAKAYFQIHFETFNTLNHAVFATPNVSSATASNSGYITAVAANSQPRQVQIGGRLVF